MSSVPNMWQKEKGAACPDASPVTNSSQPQFLYPYFTPPPMFPPPPPEVAQQMSYQQMQYNKYLQCINSHMQTEKKNKSSGSNVPQPKRHNIPFPRIVSLLNPERFKMFLTIFDIQDDMNTYIEKGSDRFNADAFFRYFLSDVETSTIHYCVIPIICNILEVLLRGTKEQLGFLIRPKIPIIFNYLHLKNGDEVKPLLKILKNNIIMNFTCFFDVGNFEKCKLEDIQIIGKVIPYPGNKQVSTVRIMVNGREISTVTFGENEHFFVLKKGIDIKKQISVSIKTETNYILWFAVIAVIPRPNIVKYLSAQQGCKSSYGISKTCICHKRGMPYYDINEIIGDIFNNGYAVCPYCNSQVYLCDICFDPVRDDLSKKQTKKTCKKRNNEMPIKVINLYHQEEYAHYRSKEIQLKPIENQPKPIENQPKPNENQPKPNENQPKPNEKAFSIPETNEENEALDNESKNKMLKYIYRSAFRDPSINWKAFNASVKSWDSADLCESSKATKTEIPNIIDDFDDNFLFEL